MESFSIRPLTPADNLAIATIIRDSLAEFGADKPGTVYFDPTTDELFNPFSNRRIRLFYRGKRPRFQPNRNIRFRTARAALIAGGSGVFPTPGLPAGYCELVKLYIAGPFRGKGLGKTLLRACFQAARALGYQNMYLETMPELHNAIGLYEREGFVFLPGPLGASGHFGCDLWMSKIL